MTAGGPPSRAGDCGFDRSTSYNPSQDFGLDTTFAYLSDLGIATLGARALVDA